MSLALGLVLALTGCGVPRDPDGTLERIDTQHRVVVGVAPAPPQVTVEEGKPVGPEAELVERFAASRGARVDWVVAGQEDLVKRMERGELDLMVGGLTSKSPIKNKVGLTRRYAEDVDVDGKPVDRVVAAPMGENALVTALETWFDEGAGR